MANCTKDSLWEDFNSPQASFKMVSVRSIICVTIYTLLFLISSLENMFVFCTVFPQLTKLKWRLTMFIFHLSISDFIVTLFVIPVELLRNIATKWLGSIWLFQFCQYGKVFGLYLGSTIVICLCLDRYIAVIYPLRMAGERKRVKVMILLAWIISGLLAFLQLHIYHDENDQNNNSIKECMSTGCFEEKRQDTMNNNFSLAVLFFLPLSIILLTTARIVWKLVTKARETKKSANSSLWIGTDTKIRNSKVHRIFAPPAVKISSKARNRTFKFTLLILSTFIICRGPFAMTMIWNMYDSNEPLEYFPALHDVLFMVVIFNSCLNPVIYGIYTKKLLGKLTCPWLCFGGRTPDEEADSRRMTSAQMAAIAFV